MLSPEELRELRRLHIVAGRRADALFTGEYRSAVKGRGMEFEEVRDSEMGGAAHACELETSAYLYLEPDRVRMDKAQDHYGGAAGSKGSKYLYVDITKGWGPIKVVKWTSSSTPNGVSGAPTLATAEKGKVLVEAASNHIVAFCREFKNMPDPVRVDHRSVKPSMPKLPNLD